MLELGVNADGSMRVERYSIARLPREAVTAGRTEHVAAGERRDPRAAGTPGSAVSRNGSGARVLVARVLPAARSNKDLPLFRSLISTLPNPGA